MRDGHELIGWSMAAGTYPVNHQPAESRLTLRQDGSLIVQSASEDIGTGTDTIMAQTAAEILRIHSETIKVQLGDTQLPRAGVAGGSQLAGNLTGALSKAATLMRERLISLAVEQPSSPLYQKARHRVTLADGQIVLAMRRGVSFGKLLQLAKMDELNVAADTFKPGTSLQDRDMLTNSSTHSTHATANGVSAHG